MRNGNMWQGYIIVLAYTISYGIHIVKLHFRPATKTYTHSINLCPTIIQGTFIYIAHSNTKCLTKKQHIYYKRNTLYNYIKKQCYIV